MIDTTNVLIESCLSEASVNQPARSKFLASLKNKILDLPAFHQAYDRLIDANGLKDIFDAKGKLAARNSYGKIKNCPDSTLAAGLKKLWIAQFKDNLRTPEEQVAYEARQKEEERRRQELEQQRLNRQQEFVKQVESIITAAKQEIVNDPEYIRINNIYRKFASANLVDDILIKGDPDRSKGPEYYVRLEGYPYYYTFKPEELTKETICKYALKLAENYIKEQAGEYFKNVFEDYVDELGLSTREANTVYLLDNYTDQVYYLTANSKTGTFGFTDENNRDSEVDIKEMPDLDKLQVIALKHITYSHSGNCYYGIAYDLYYNPKQPTELLNKCGVTFKEVLGTGWDNGVELCSFLDPNKIAFKYRRLGLTKGEHHSYEVDSSD